MTDAGLQTVDFGEQSIAAAVERRSLGMQGNGTAFQVSRPAVEVGTAVVEFRFKGLAANAAVVVVGGQAVAVGIESRAVDGKSGGRCVKGLSFDGKAIGRGRDASLSPFPPPDCASSQGEKARPIRGGTGPQLLGLFAGRGHIAKLPVEIGQ